MIDRCRQIVCYQEECHFCQDNLCNNEGGIYIQKDGYCSYYYHKYAKYKSYYDFHGSLADQITD